MDNLSHLIARHAPPRYLRRRIPRWRQRLETNRALVVRMRWLGYGPQYNPVRLTVAESNQLEKDLATAQARLTEGEYE